MQVHWTIAAALWIAHLVATPAAAGPLVVAGDGGNDLYRALSAGGSAPARYDTAREAVARAPRGAGVLLLADRYPRETLQLSSETLAQAAEKNLRLYVEYAAELPGLQFGEPRSVEHERVVAATPFLEPRLPRHAILSIHQARFVPVEGVAGDLVLARVAGFDRALYGLPDRAYPLLFQHPDAELLVATTKLSQFVTARFAPPEAWAAVWKYILQWVTRSENAPELSWTPAVRPSFQRGEALPRDAERQALRRGIDWFSAARLLMHPSWKDRFEQAQSYPDRVAPGPLAEWPVGDGSEGLLEGFSSQIQPDGSQWVRWYLRSDCIGETAGAYALAAAVFEDERYAGIARNLLDYLYFKSPLTSGPRGDPQSPSYGLPGWSLPDAAGVYYGDDIVRALLGTLVGAGASKTGRWDEPLLRGLLANLRTTGALGFRGRRIEEEDLQRNGWRHYFERDTTYYSAHFEAYPLAAYLWAYQKTGHELFLERARTGIAMMMEAYPEKWIWQNGFQQERARMLLPLAWLVRVEDTPQHRGWLRRVAGDLLAFQDESGAIREELGPAGQGRYAAPQSNEEYGTTEAPLIQENGDPLSDVLYTSNFAFLGLHEAAAATGEELYRDAADRLTEYLCRIQVASEVHPELDGAWFRAFDYRRWDYWASNADAGWGAWSVETGWTQAWITSVLALRQLNTSAWELTSGGSIKQRADELIPEMLPR